MAPKFLAEFPELKADIQLAPSQPDPNSIDFEGVGNGFGLGTTSGLESLPNGFLEGEGLPQMDWSGNQSNMRAGEA